jgi:hypothetical protein
VHSEFDEASDLIGSFRRRRVQNYVRVRTKNQLLNNKKSSRKQLKNNKAKI